MAGPTWVSLSLAVLMVATSVYCAGRLVISRRREAVTQRDVDGVHVVMGVVMAGMLAGAPSFGWSGLWKGFFGVSAAWFGRQSRWWPPRSRVARRHPLRVRELLRPPADPRGHTFDQRWG
jgi:hypothetical protein